MSDAGKSDPKDDAERRLRQMLAAEARTQREQLGMIQKGFYGCVGLIVLGFLLLLFFF
jgi:hypothetical protein